MICYLPLRARIIIVLLLVLMLFGLSMADLDHLELVRGGLFCVLLLVMAVIDFRTGLLPDKGNLYLAGLGLMMAGVMGEAQDALLGALLGAALLFALRTLSRGGIGLGDVKYAAAFGIWLGWQGTLLALALSFALGACLALVLLGMTEITAVSTYFITFFDTFGIDLTHWKWLIELCFLVSLVSINLIAVKVFGEVEFWFSMIKITLICAMIATAVVMIVIGYHYPAVQIHGVDHVSPAGHAGFDNLFANFSFAPNGWMAFLMSFQMVFFAYEMIEFVGVTVSETKNPRKVLPKAINEIIVRVLIFYVGALVAIMCIVPWTSFKPNKDGSFASPFIMMFQYAGLNWASALVFFVVITAASSALNSLLYSAGRHLYQLSEVSPNPTLNKLGKVSDRKVPARAILVSAALILLSPIVNAIPGVSGAFVLFSSASSAVFLFIYILTLMAHRKYRRSADFIPDGFVMPAWKVLNTVAIVFFVFIYLTLFLADDTRNSAIAGLVWLVGFGGFSMLRERYRSRDLKAALEHKE